MLQARRGLVVAAALSFALASFAPPPALAAAADPVLLERAAAEREVYGLATDMTTMLRLFAGADVGTAKWGIPLTEEEEQALDLDARMTFVDELNDKLLPYARSLPTFAGAWVDQLHEGGVVIALTEMDPVTVQAVTDLLPPDSRGLEFQSASNSYQTLKRKVDEAREAMSLVAPDVKITSVSIDTTRNGVRIKISKASSEGGIAAAPVVEQRVGVPIFLEEELIADDVSCTTPATAAFLR